MILIHKSYQWQPQKISKGIACQGPLPQTSSPLWPCCSLSPPWWRLQCIWHSGLLGWAPDICPWRTDWGEARRKSGTGLGREGPDIQTWSEGGSHLYRSWNIRQSSTGGCGGWLVVRLELGVVITLDNVFNCCLSLTFSTGGGNLY